MADPRAMNCQAFKVDTGGKVVGVELQYLSVPSAPYELYSVYLLDEVEAQGNTVATNEVYDENGLPVGERVFLCWPWPDWTEKALPGNPNNTHMISNGYSPPAVGPLALFVGDAAGIPLSDFIGGLGLPFNRHVSYRCVWRKRTEAPPDDGGCDLQPVLDAVAALDAKVTALAAHLGKTF